MSVLDRIGEMLKAKTAPQQQPQQENGQMGVVQQNQQQPPQNGQQQTQPQSQNPNDARLQQQQDDVASIWGTQPTAAASSAPVFTPDMNAFKESVSKMDFTQGLDPELAKKALTGDTQALSELLNMVGRSTYSSATTGAHQLLETALAKRTAELEKTIDSRLNSFSAQNRIQESNPAFRNPAIAPLLKDVQARLQAKYPEASAAELAERAEKFLTGIAKDIYENTQEARTKAQTAQTQQQSGETDWGTWATQGTEGFKNPLLQ